MHRPWHQLPHSFKGEEALCRYPFNQDNPIDINQINQRKKEKMTHLLTILELMALAIFVMIYFSKLRECKDKEICIQDNLTTINNLLNKNHELWKENNKLKRAILDPSTIESIEVTSGLKLQKDMEDMVWGGQRYREAKTTFVIPVSVNKQAQ
jgi:hypothetical protein